MNSYIINHFPSHTINYPLTLNTDDYCTRQIKMRIVIAKEAFNRNMSLLTSKPNIELKNKLVRCYVWSIISNSPETWTLKNIRAEMFGEF